jgi:Kef-type K+ transport system membrane component KefB
MKTKAMWRWLVLAVLMVAGVAAAAETGEAATPETAERMTTLMLQLAVILCAAKLAAYACEHILKIPEVLGELAAGMLIGPYALGPFLGLFDKPLGGGMPVSPELYGIATLASIILLYAAGLETDLSMFLRYSVAGSLVGVGGVLFSFVLGCLCAVWTGLADSMLSPAALFLGTISTATSVGITARILSERNKLTSAEGVTILAGAVIDDVLGIIILAVVVGMARLADSSAVDWARVSWIGLKAVGFWVICTFGGIVLAGRIGKLLEFFGSREKMAALALGLALLLAGLSEKAGLAMIIGAYIMGLALSRVDCANVLRRRLEPLYETLVSVFFCVMGMMVDFGAMRHVLAAGLVFSGVAILAKMLGCGLPAALMGFNTLGSLRVGTGMLPRGEVALIVAGIGLSSGLVSADIFGVAVMMTLITTAAAPLIMVRIFDDRRGLRKAEEAESEREARQSIRLELPNSEVADFLLSTVLRMFEQE